MVEICNEAAENSVENHAHTALKAAETMVIMLDGYSKIEARLMGPIYVI